MINVSIKKSFRLATNTFYPRSIHRWSHLFAINSPGEYSMYTYTYCTVTALSCPLARLPAELIFQRVGLEVTTHVSANTSFLRVVPGTSETVGKAKRAIRPTRLMNRHFVEIILARSVTPRVRRRGTTTRPLSEHREPRWIIGLENKPLLYLRDESLAKHAL